MANPLNTIIKRYRLAQGTDPRIVYTVAELASYMPGTAFLDSDGDVCIVGYRGRIVCQDGDVYAVGDLEDSLPAVVLQVPEVELP